MQDLLTRLLLAGGGGFSPSALFGGGAVQGAWYDPSDFGTTGTGGVGTLYQDSAGTTPVTAVEQPVGLMLDKSKGLVLGSEAVASPYTGSTSGTWAVSATSVTRNSSASGQAAVNTNASISTSKYYLVTFVVSNLSGDDFFFRIGAGGTAYRVSANGTYTARVIGGGTSSSIVFAPWAGTAGEATITNISVRELPGNHAYQSTSASRPTLRARYNLLTRSEEFGDAAWVKVAGSVSVSQNAVGPTGVSNSATTVTALAGTNNHWLYQSFASSAVAYSQSVYAKAGTANWIGVSFGAGATTDGVFFNLSNGTVGAVAFGSTGTIQNVGNGWYRCTVTRTGPGGTYFSALEIHTADSQALNWNAAGTETILIWGAQLVPTAVFPSNTYQRIGAATDYATGTAFPPYLFFDGLDDSMLTNSVDFATVTSDGQARRNLLSNPTQFDDAAWTKSLSGILANAAVAPDGTTTADLLYPSSSGQFRNVSQNAAGVYPWSTQSTLSVYAKAAGVNFLAVINAAGNSAGAVFNLTNGTVTTIDASFTTSITSVGSGWYRLSVTANAGFTYFYPVDNAATNSVTANGTDGVFLWGAQLETGSTATAFQNIGTDQMTVFAGVTKNSDAASGMVVELSADLNANNGTFAVVTGSASTGPGAGWAFGSKGTTTRNANSPFSYPAPITNVVTGVGNIGGDVSQVRINAAVAATDTNDQGTGNYGNYPLYIGRRNNASLPFNGNLYSLIVQGATPTSSQLVSTEQWVAAKTPLGSV